MKQKIVKGSHSLMKGLNESSILNIILAYGPISRIDISHKLNVSIPTATRITDRLLEEGLIINTGLGASSGGRKAPIFEINPSGAYIFGAQIGSTIDIILTNLKAEILDSTSSPASDFQSPDDTVKYISRSIDAMVSRNGIPETKIYGVGLGVPGVNFRAKPVIEASVFKGWNSVNLSNLVKGHIKYRTFIENIAYTSTLREYWFGAGKGFSNIIHLLVDNGVGGGVILNGKLYKGINGKAGILGHMSIEFDGEECYCGNNGCLETYVSVPSIVKRIRRLVGDGIPSTLTALRNSHDEITFNDICSAAAEGDILSTKIIKEAGQRLGSAAASLANIFDPELIILSGGAVEGCPLLLESARTEALERIFFFIDVNKRLQIVSGSRNQNSALGCVALVLQLIFEQKI